MPTNHKPILVCSLPKSGTYFIALILKKLGYKDTNWHIGPEAWQDYSKATDSHARQSPEKFTVRENCQEVIQRIPAGAFALSHLGCEDFAKSPDRITLILMRDLKDVLPSYYNWINATQRWGNPDNWRGITDERARFAKFMKVYRHRLKPDVTRFSSWLQQPESVAKRHLHYEHLNSPNPDIRMAVSRQLATSLACDPQSVYTAITESIGKETITSLGNQEQRTSYSKLWSLRSHWYYQRKGYYTINQQIRKSRKLQLEAHKD